MVWLSGVETQGLGDILPLSEAEEGEDEIAKSSKTMMSTSDTQGGEVFVESDIADIVETIFNGPMLTGEGKQSGGIGLGGGNAIGEFKGVFAGGQMGGGADELKGLVHSLPIQILVEVDGDINAAYDEATMRFFDEFGTVVGKTRGWRFGKPSAKRIEGQFLIAFDRQEVVPACRQNLIHHLVLGEQSIGCHQAARQVHPIQQVRHGPDFIRLIADRHLSQHHPAGRGQRR